MKDYTPIKGATKQTLVVTPYHRYDLGDYECLVTVHIGGEEYYTISRYFTKRLAYDSGTALSIDTFELKDGKLMIGGSASSNKIKEDDYLEVIIRDGKTNPEISDASLGIFTRESLRSWEKTGSFNKEFVISVGELALDDLGIYEIYASSYTAESKPVVLSFELKESGVVLAKLTDEKGNTKSLEIAGPETTQLRFKADAESFIQLKAEDIGSLVLSGEAVNNDSEKAIAYTWKVGGKVVSNEAVYTLETVDLADISYNYSARLTISVTASDGMESISRDFYLETLYFTEDFDAHGSADMYPYAGDKITLTAEAYSALSETLSYQWYKDGTAIEGANEASFTIEKMKDADYGEYSCEVSDGVHENAIRRSFRLMEKDYAMRISEFKLVDNESLIIRGNAYKNKTEEWSYCDVYFINLGERIPEYKTDGEEMTELSERGMHLAGLVRNNSYKYETEESFNCDIDIELLDLQRLMLGDYVLNMNCNEYNVDAHLVVTEENGEYTAKLVFDDGTVLIAEKASSESVKTDLKLTANANMVSENSAGYAVTVYAKAGERYVFCAEATNNDPENYPITYSWYDADPRAYGSIKKIDDGANCGIEITESGTIWCVITDGVETITLAQTYEAAEGAVFASHDQYGGNGIPAGQKYFFGERNMMPESIVTLDAAAINGAAAFSYAWTLNGNDAGNEAKLTVYGYQLENDHVNTAVCTVTDGVETLTMEIDLIPMEWLNSWNVKTNLRVTVPEDLNYETTSEPTYRVGLTNSDVGGLTLSVAAENDDPEIYPISYQWYLDEEELAGETNASLALPLTLQDVIDGNFGRYKVVISDGIEEKVVWFELISFYFTEEDPQYAVPAKPGEKVTFDAAAVSVLDSSLGYQWFRNGEAITGATEATYTITASISDFSSAYLCDVPRYTCTVTDNVLGKQLTSNEYYLVYDVEPQLKIDNFAFLGDKLVFGGEASAEKYYANGSFDFRIESEDENGAFIVPVGNDVLGGYKREYETKTHDCLEFEYYIRNVTELSLGKYELSMMYDAKGYIEGEDWYYNGEVWYLEIEKSWDSRYTATLTSPDGAVKTVTSEALGGTGLEIIGKSEEFFYIPTEGSSEQIALSAEATNMNETILPISYQWYFTPYGSNTMEQIEGANDPIYVVDPSDEANFGTYYCAVRDGVESCSYSGHILYGTTLDWVYFPYPYVVFANVGETATVTVEASSNAGEVSYTWYEDEISEGCMIGTGPTLTIESVAERDYGSSFICVATDGYRTIEEWLRIRPQTNLTLTLEQDNILVKKGEKVEIRGFATMDKESGKELGIMMAILEPWQDMDGFWHDNGVNDWFIVSEENEI
ncbi:MAG: immunoglobulin domain-containing protein, partial [Christensenellaceae bacterium]|nr:immunoglobulin domain-containing protein [Christensenellaceae bacterium]